ncbi:MAG: hypothetical protein C0175_01600 [Caldisericum exile]|uniref:Type II toxin-antitoxin system RelE/ParE family toxin n=1 Tax=Caldisericum exile TaxID=693075 RepID=A0A2J6X8H8_9BACT|nr:MAG: hypothetical protein C0175_01600 [Caldisericum exile]
MKNTFEIRLTRNAEKDLIALKDLINEALDELTVLKDDPYKGHALKGSIYGVRSLEFSMKGTAYRAAYILLEDEKICLVFVIGSHEGFYSKVERRAKGLKKKFK